MTGSTKLPPGTEIFQSLKMPRNPSVPLIRAKSQVGFRQLDQPHFFLLNLWVVMETGEGCSLMMTSWLKECATSGCMAKRKGTIIPFWESMVALTHCKLRSFWKKLEIFDDEILRRQKVAQAYGDGIRNSSVTLPRVGPGNTSVFAQYTILSSNRDALAASLKEARNSFRELLRGTTSFAACL